MLITWDIFTFFLFFNVFLFSVLSAIKLAYAHTRNESRNRNSFAILSWWRFRERGKPECQWTVEQCYNIFYYSLQYFTTFTLKRKIITSINVCRRRYTPEAHDQIKLFWFISTRIEFVFNVFTLIFLVVGIWRYE